MCHGSGVDCLLSVTCKYSPSMESMADARPRFLFESPVAHLSDLRQKGNKSNRAGSVCASMTHKNSIDAYSRLTTDLNKKEKDKSAIMNADME